jgi:hypothetical protein
VVEAGAVSVTMCETVCTIPLLSVLTSGRDVADVAGGEGEDDVGVKADEGGAEDEEGGADETDGADRGTDDGRTDDADAGGAESDADALSVGKIGGMGMERGRDGRPGKPGRLGNGSPPMPALGLAPVGLASEPPSIPVRTPPRRPMSLFRQVQGGR